MGYIEDRFVSDKQSMNREHVELWLEAMESEKYPQCFGQTFESTFEGKMRMCAIGVAYAVYLEAHNRSVTNAEIMRTKNSEVNAWYGVTELNLLLGRLPNGDWLGVVSLNDDDKESFPGIAQRIRKEYF